MLTSVDLMTEWNCQLLAWDGLDGVGRQIVMLIGIATTLVGVWLMFRHRSEMQRAEIGNLDSREFRFAVKKFRRRMTGSCLIALIGVLLCGLYWTEHPKVFSLITLIILILLPILFGIAVVDMLNVGIRAIADPQNEKRKALIEEVLRMRKKAEQANANGDVADETESKSVIDSD